MDLRDRLQSTLGDAYSVERELGGGGMSRVFLAHEAALGRRVVVKVLSGDMIAGISAERFAREVRLAASLQHPNIVPVLTTGIADTLPYFTMPYVRGESLRVRMNQGGPVPRRHVLSVLRDIARALQYAHAEGVIHRDIKPDNVLLSGDAAVVTDFGIAKAISVARTSGAEPARPDADPHTLTQAGLTVGTPAYMAPEQAAADVMDHRVDIYAWGILAYELLSGAHPFAGKVTAAQLMAAHLGEKPVPLGDKVPDLPPVLSQLVMQCIEKHPEKRPASASEILDGLDGTFESRESPSLLVAKAKRGIPRKPVAIGIAAVLLALMAYAGMKVRQPAAIDNINSVAVLPFADDRADSANAYFGEGIADQLMTELAKVPGLRVASRTSAIALGRRSDLDVREIARQLGVTAVVEGTVRRAGDQLRVAAQLINASDGLILWSDTYERESKDVFSVQDDITRSIVAALRPEFTRGGGNAEGPKPAGTGTSSPEAYDLYLRGLYLVERRGQGVVRAADYFSQAIAKDSGYARAYAALAGALQFFPYFAGVPSDRIEARTRAAATRSLQLDSTLAEPRVALAMADWHAFRWREAEAEFRRAIAADSASSIAHTQYGRFLLSIGRVPHALEEFRIARRLDPLAGTSYVWLAYSLGRMGDEASALAESKRARELDPTLITTFTILALERAGSGRYDQAREIVGHTNPPIPFNGMTAYVLQKAGETTRAAELRRQLDEAPDSTWMIHTGRAFAYLATGDTARALNELEAGFVQDEDIAHWVPFIDPMYDPIRRSARFANILRRAGLEGRGFDR